MVQIEVNGKKVEAQPNELLLKVLQRNGIDVPTLCYMKDKFPSGACRMCVVEVEGAPNLVPSCAATANQGMKVQTHSPRVLRARKTIVELLLANHPNDCLYCVRNSDCDLRGLAESLNVRQHRFSETERVPEIDNSSDAIVRDQSKCILCGRCVRVCEETMGVSAIDFMDRGSKAKVGPAFNQGMNLSSCVNCGQCIVACPTGALREKSHLRAVAEALADPEKYVVVQHAPAVSVTLGENFGVKPGEDVDGVMVAALRKMGFKQVFDTSFTADLTIMEEGSELVERITKGGKLPMMTSCSPGWINFIEEFYPSWIPNLSTCKSPQQMMGALIKSYFAKVKGIDPSKIFSVSIMPCTAKKGEAGRLNMLGEEGYADVDAVLTTRELSRMIQQRGIKLAELQPEQPDSILGDHTSAGKIFGASGGVMEAALRSAYFLITGKNLEKLDFTDVRGLQGIKESSVTIGDLKLDIAVVSGLGNARLLMEDMEKGIRKYHFIEVMTCPGGCIAGGGQPQFTDVERVKARMAGLYTIDKNAPLRMSHQNPTVQKLYTDFLGKPLGHKSHELLHTTYQARRERR